jgi:hypothetical protein
LYGPDENTRLSYWVLVSLDCGVGANVFIDAVMWNSDTGWFSLKTIVLSSGTSMAVQPLPPLLPATYGPL